MSAKWGQALKFFENETKKKYVKYVQGIEDYAYNQLRSKSPVDTGAFRSNWNRTLNKPRYTFDSGKTNSIQPSPLPSGTFFNMYVSNGAPYATKLEEGHSEQAPAGVLALAYQSTKVKYGF